MISVRFDAGQNRRREQRRLRLARRQESDMANRVRSDEAWTAVLKRAVIARRL